MPTTQTSQETKKVIALLGGPQVFHHKISDGNDMQEALRKGLPYATFEAVLKALDVGSKDLADLLGVAARTLARRKKTHQLSPAESDRLYRVAYITLLATDVLGSLEKARSWLHKSNRALGGHSPISFLDTAIGERHVEDLLNRINYGIYS